MSTTQLSVNREATRRRILLTLKKYSYLIAMVPLVLPLCCWPPATPLIW